MTGSCTRWDAAADQHCGGTPARQQTLPLMARLARHRVRARIPQGAIAHLLGVDRVTVYRWEASQRSPHYLHAVAYAHRIGDQIILRDRQRILATDGDIPAAIPQLRAAAGLTPRQYARRLHIIGPAVHAAERRGYQLLSSYETAAHALGYTIGLAAAHA